jgi:hypothetical protein
VMFVEGASVDELWCRGGLRPQAVRVCLLLCMMSINAELRVVV